MLITRWVAGALLVLLTVSGCVNRTGGGEDERAPLATTEEPLTAADGTDVSACADGTCEILIEDTTNIPIPGGSLSITVVDHDAVEYGVTINGSTATGSTEGNCVTWFTTEGGGSGSTCYTEGGEVPELEPTPGEITMQVEGQDGSDTLVLRLVTG